MSVKIMGMVWDASLNKNLKFILLAYADHADHEGRNIFPSIETIAKKTGYDERSIQRITTELENIGYLVLDGDERKGGSGNTTLWRIPIKGDKIAPFKKGDKSAPNSQKRVTNRAKKGDTMSPDPSLKANVKKNEPSARAEAPPAWASLELPEVLKLPEIALYRKIAGRIPGRAQWGFIYDAIQQIGLDENKLAPFWRAHITRGGKTEALYWLTEWAVAGKVPNGHSPAQNGQTKHARNLAALAEVVAEFEGANGT